MFRDIQFVITSGHHIKTQQAYESMLKTVFLRRLDQGAKSIFRFYKRILNGYTTFKNRNQQQINKINRRYCFLNSLTFGTLILRKRRGTPLISSINMA